MLNDQKLYLIISEVNSAKRQLRIRRRQEYKIFAYRYQYFHVIVILFLTEQQTILLFPRSIERIALIASSSRISYHLGRRSIEHRNKRKKRSRTDKKLIEPAKYNLSEDLIRSVSNTFMWKKIQSYRIRLVYFP